MQHQRPAAALRRRDRDVAPLCRQNARRRPVDVAEEDPLHAAEQQRHASPRFALRRHVRRHRRPGAAEGKPGRDRFHGAHACGQQPQQAGRACDPLQPRPPVRPERERHPSEPTGVRKQREDHPPEQPVAERTHDVALDLRARRLDQLVVLHAGRAGGDTGHTPEAGVEMAGERAVDFRLPFGCHLHQVDPPARRVGLPAPERVCRTGGQAEPAVDAVRQQIRRRGMVRIERAGRRGSWAVHRRCRS